MELNWQKDSLASWTCGVRTYRIEKVSSMDFDSPDGKRFRVRSIGFTMAGNGRTYGCVECAKAACQAAEDKLCAEVWPKYTERIWNQAVYDVWESESHGYNVDRFGKKRRKEGCFYSDRPRKVITETEALSRLEIPMEPRLVIDVMQMDNVLVVKLVHVDEILRVPGTQFRGHLFTIDCGTSDGLATGTLFIQEESKGARKLTASCTYAHVTSATTAKELLSDAVKALNEKYTAPRVSDLSPVADGWTRLS